MSIVGGTLLTTPLNSGFAVAAVTKAGSLGATTVSRATSKLNRPLFATKPDGLPSVSCSSRYTATSVELPGATAYVAASVAYL